MIVAGPEGFIKGQYRKFNMKSEDLVPGDDYAMMREMLTRRFSRSSPRRRATEWLGRARPGADRRRPGPARRRLCGAGRTRPVGDQGGGGGQGARPQCRPRAHSISAARSPLLLEPRDPVLYCIQTLRDEAHRFAIGAHRAKRKKAITASPLDEVPGIGPNRKRALLQHFGSAKAVSRAGVADLEGVGGISAQMAKSIYDHFHERG